VYEEKMAELKTKLNNSSVKDFLNSVQDKQKRDDCFALAKLMQDVTGEKPKMWGSSIVGFGSYHYVYESGHEGDICKVGFSPRKQNLTLYVMPPTDNTSFLKELGKYKTSKSCLYINRLNDIHLPTLKKLIQHSLKYISSKYPSD
jgi:hypothetical protein